MMLCGTTRRTFTILALVFFLIGGASLPAQDEPARPPRSLQEKMQRFHRHAVKWQQVSRIMKDFHPLVEQGQFERAEALLDHLPGWPTARRLPCSLRRAGRTRQSTLGKHRGISTRIGAWRRLDA